MYVYIYIYIYIERESERDVIYIYIYIYIYLTWNRGFPGKFESSNLSGWGACRSGSARSGSAAATTRSRWTRRPGRASRWHLIGPADCNHYDCNHVLFSVSGNFRWIIIIIIIMRVYIYIYIYIYIYTYILYIYRERDIERERETCVYTYIYIYSPTEWIHPMHQGPHSETPPPAIVFNKTYNLDLLRVTTYQIHKTELNSLQFKRLA